MLVGALIAHWKAKLSPVTLYNRVAVLRRLFRILETYGAAPHALLLPRVKRAQHRTKTATHEQLRAMMLKALPHARLFILLAWQMALRFSECFAVTPASHNREKQTITIRTKGGKVRTLPTTPEIEALLAAAGDVAGSEDLPYIAILKGGSCHPRAFRHTWKKMLRQAGIEDLHPHDLRRTTLNNLYGVCKDLRAVQQFAGHESLSSTTHYLAPLSEEPLREMHQLLNFHTNKKETVQ